MCLGLYALSNLDYALILCANRDEYLERPTLAAAFHSFEPLAQDVHSPPAPSSEGLVLSGRDCAAGGTWLGVSRSGRIAVLTNITEEHGSYSTSRGELASSFLTSNLPLSEYVTKLTAQENWKSYAGFNMLLLSPSSAVPLQFDGRFVSNGGAGGAITARALRPDEFNYGGISNGAEASGGDEWPKVVEGRTNLARAVEGYRDRTDVPNDKILIDSLFDVLSSHSESEIRSRGDLRNTVRVEPLHVPYPTKDRSSTVPRSYGTRLATFLLVRRTGEVTFVERDVWKTTPSGSTVFGSPDDDRVHRFSISLP
ncbi:hypothetical protein FRB94_005608 [Tulasnella sp. JGI-2019a]|nr:hypothetical protein FRB93_006318 [Tulasnella sp. JGI-2019a]KAG9000212.1 hypothetical protein FRB94_005608 [Tulasnella sp. JGI-2019a]KAG9028590.1 hypothetical protein FRB95_006310 [Tulasnella sp. JGI-2019a]